MDGNTGWAPTHGGRRLEAVSRLQSVPALEADSDADRDDQETGNIERAPGHGLEPSKPLRGVAYRKRRGSPHGYEQWSTWT